MHSCKNISLFLFVLILSSIACVQDLHGQVQASFSGVARDSITGQPVQGATMLILQNQEIKGYGLTNNNGHYKVEAVVAEDVPIELSCRHISYLPVSKYISALNLSGEIDFKLTPSSKTLSEVLLNSEKQTQNDTTEFLVRSITNAQTRKVEDLLKKLPGFEVLKNGQLKYNDRNVQAVLLNGDNLSGGNYGVITRNLDANTLDKVQVIDNFSENRIIGSVFKTGDIAVNLVTKDELEGKLDGSVDAATSFFKRYDLGVNLIAIKNRLQALVFSGTNNIGEDKNPSFNVKSNSNLITYQSNDLAYFQTTPVNVIKNSNLADNYLPNEKRKNVFPTFSIPISKSLKLLERFSLGTYNSMASVNESSRTRISDTDFYDLKNLSVSDNRLINIENVTTLKFDNYKRNAFEIGFGYNRKSIVNHYTLLQTGDYTDSLSSYSDVPFAKYTLTVSGAYLMAPKKVLGYSLNAFYINDDGRVSFETRRFTAFFDQPFYNRFLQQEVAQKNGVVIADLFYLKKRKRGSNSYKVSNVYYQNDISRRVAADSNENYKTSIPVSVGKNRLTFNKASFEFISKYRNYSNQDLELYAVAGMYKMIMPTNKNYFHYSISGTATGKLFNTTYYTATIGSRRTMESPELILKDSLIEAVSLIRLASQDYKPVSTHGIGLSLTRKGWVDYGFGYSFVWQTNNFEPVIQYDPRLTLYYMELFGGGIRHKVRFNAKVYSMKMKGTFFLNTQYQNQHTSGELNGTPVKRIANSLKSSLRYVSNFKTMYNFEISYTHGLNYFRQKGADKLRSNNQDELLYLSQRLDISKSFFIGAAYSYYQFSAGSFNQADVFSTWQITASTRLDLRAVNLLNQKVYRIQSNDVNNEFKMDYDVAKPYLLISIQQQF